MYTNDANRRTKLKINPLKEAAYQNRNTVLSGSSFVANCDVFHTELVSNHDSILNVFFMIFKK